jgi:glycosyltransferase involved in cell wall biosynthesis
MFDVYTLYVYGQKEHRSNMKVAVILHDKTVASGFYRIVQPYTYLRDVLHKDVFIFDSKVHDDKCLRSEIEKADVFILQSPGNENMYRLVKVLMGRKDKVQKVVADYDDDIFRVGPWNATYSIFGTQEVGGLYLSKQQVESLQGKLRQSDKPLIRMNPDGSAIVDVWKDKHENFLWETKFGKFDIETNKLRLKRTGTFMREVDLLTVTTRQLADELRQYRPKGTITVLPNMVNFDKFLPMKKKNDGKLRIVWQGGSSHYLDLAMVKDELISFAKKHPEVEFVFQGQDFPGIFQEISDRVKWLPWHYDFDTYPSSLRELAGDIAICPLTDDAFNAGKSPLKWAEMSAMKVPSVCSPIVYGNYIEHGTTGFIAKQGEWETYLERLLDPKFREQIGQNAYDAVKKEFSLKNATKYWSALEGLFV